MVSGRKSTYVGRLALFAVLGCSLAMVASCGQGKAEPTSGSTIADSKVDRDVDVINGGPSKATILSESELPGGWRKASGQQYLGIPNFCDILLEPPGLTSSSTQRFTKGFAGPFVIQHVFVTNKVSAAKTRLEHFAKAIKACDAFTDRAGVGWTAQPVDNLTTVGTEFAAVHLERTTSANDSFRFLEYIAYRNDDTVTVLTSYSPGYLAKPTEIDAFTSAIAAKVPGSSS